MEFGKMPSPKSMLKDAEMMEQILKDMEITEYEVRVVNQMLEFAFQIVTTILDDAKISKRVTVDAHDVRLAIQCWIFLLDIEERNQILLQSVKPYSSPRLPLDRYCLTSNSSTGKCWLSFWHTKCSHSSHPIPQTMSVSTKVNSLPAEPPEKPSTKVGTPMSLTEPRFTVQIPASQSPAVKASVLATAAAHHIQVNPSIGYKNTIITTNITPS
ncbi:hypothetical protein FD755_000437 [Muntiacus reevesi]|uniref:Uncharacterized protein n=1 Tax=Muntiacus reevesi TaxID=9886 RepID=A0A5J5MYT1_MUNRE|nr:hypothetical protein FD755_000437 [Muntiacus reevesi]